MYFKDTAEEAARMLGLKDPVGILAQDKTSVVVRWKNDNGKYEQVEIIPEDVLLREGNITAEGLKKEIVRLIETDQTKVFN